MSFVSLVFLVFVCVTFVIYFAIPKKYQWICLLVASYIFYLSYSIGMGIFIVITTITTFFAAKFMQDFQQKGEKFIAENKENITVEQKKSIKSKVQKRRRLIMWSTVILNFGILGYFKYLGVFMQNILNLLGYADMAEFGWAFSIILPIGISFYTFQSISYVLDVYRKKYSPAQNIAKYALFVSFFPQILQGPISRYNELSTELYKEHKLNYSNCKNGVLLILWGLFKVLIIASRAGVLVETVLANYAGYSGSIIFIGMIMYVIQLYCSFSGGIDIARGVAQIFGITMTQNFQRPFCAKSASEFWRRWHISLGTWMKDYVFFPLSISKTFASIGRKSKKLFGKYVGKVLPTCIASIIVFLLVGVWHGASLNYVAFGLYYGVIIAISTLLEPTFHKITSKLKIKTNHFGYVLFQRTRTAIIFLISAYFAVAAGLKASLIMLKTTVANFDVASLLNGSLLNLGITKFDYFIIAIGVVILWVVGSLQEKNIAIRESLSKKNICIRYCVYLLLVFSILMLSLTTSHGGFMYEKF
ncbi:MAG: MBOAT family O-acyltransferase [Christensenellaceae bacterium]